jgi:formylglycine-generating enzyme required for sulfatase activity
MIEVGGMMESLFVNSIGMTLLPIPAGEFEMGSLAKASYEMDELPQHKVVISRPFYLGMYPVTQGEYFKVMNKQPSFFSGDDRLPVETVSWFDAVEFCNAQSAIEGLPSFYRIKAKVVDVPDWSSAGYRLPTEAEWEYACRAGTTTRYSCGDKQKLLKEYAWFRSNAKQKTHPVGELKPNAFGLHDMHGNVFEWCWDSFDFNSNYYSRSPVEDPRGPEQSSARMSRGGSFLHPGHSLRSACRCLSSPDSTGKLSGFRVSLGARSSQ